MEELVYFSTRITKDLKKKLKLKSIDLETNVQALTIRIFEEWLQKNEEEKK